MIPRLIALVAAVLIMTSDKIPPAANWRAVICYGGGYRLENEKGKELQFGLNSAHLIDWANKRAKKRKLTVNVTYYAEGEQGLERTDPWGPKLLPYGNVDDD